VPKPGFKLCYKHWKESKTQEEPGHKGPAAIRAEPKPEPQPEEASLSATALGERIGLSGQRTNQLLAELGWLTREKKGWVATDAALALGAIQREHHQTGIPFVLWPASIAQNKVLVATVRSVTGQGEVASAATTTAPTPAPTSTASGFREKFAATHRATDGHWVRSRAEMLVDNWLYMAGIVHAYERQLPIEEELYCDFYIPSGKVYIEYWGLESDPKYEARKKVKLELYRKYNFHLIQLTDEHIRNLDDHLPKMLLKFNVLVS
jgi:hypothetical protein